MLNPNKVYKCPDSDFRLKIKIGNNNIRYILYDHVRGNTYRRSNSSKISFREFECQTQEAEDLSDVVLIE